MTACSVSTRLSHWPATTRPTDTELWPYVQVYELVDTDMGLQAGDGSVTGVADIKRLYQPPASVPGMDLAALTRMSEAAATDHKNTRWTSCSGPTSATAATSCGRSPASGWCAASLSGTTGRRSRSSRT